MLTPQQVREYKLTEADVVNYCGSKMSDGQLTERDIAIVHFKNNYALGDRNPVDHVKFYDSSNLERGSFNIDKTQVSLLTPDRF